MEENKGGRTTLSETDTSTRPVALSHSTLSICTRFKGTAACLAIVATSALLVPRSQPHDEVYRTMKCACRDVRGSACEARRET